MDIKRKRILAFVEYYEPGWKAGGPIRSIVNITNALGEEFDFLIVTRDRDAGDKDPYPDTPVMQWVRHGKANVFYIPQDHLQWQTMQRVIRGVRPDILFLNSYFSPLFSICPALLRRFGCILRMPMIVAPRGEFSGGALGIKWIKKQLYIAVANILSVYYDVYWMGSSEKEIAEIRKIVGPGKMRSCNPELVVQDTHREGERAFLHDSNIGEMSSSKMPGQLHVVFLSRICRMKNLLFALDLLRNIRGEITFDIYGPVADEAYWSECSKRIGGMPASCRVSYHGPVPHNQVHDTMRRYHLMVLPTLGENYGHVIVEALRAGCPVLISDRTPWRGLEKMKCGWDLSLDAPDLFGAAIQQMVDLDYTAWQNMSRNVLAYADQEVRRTDAIDSYRKLFIAASNQKMRH